ncbi:hypothetical protein ACP4OV_025759 [Aristida adscensionis]
MSRPCDPTTFLITRQRMTQQSSTKISMAANHKSPCGSVAKPLTTTQVLIVPKYATAVARTPTGRSLRSKPFHFDGRWWRVKVYPTGKLLDSVRDAPDFVAVFVKFYGEPLGPFRPPRTGAAVTVEILDDAGEHPVFDNHTAESALITREHGLSAFSKGYVRFARRRELEASSCAGDDFLKVRCTLLVDAKPAKPPPSLLTPWRNTSKVTDKGNVPAPPPPSSEAKTISDGLPEVVAGSHTLTIDAFSCKRRSLRPGECVRSRQFNVGGSSWYVKVYPKGPSLYGSDSDHLSLYGKSDEPATAAEFSFVLVNADAGGNKSGKMTRTFDGANPQHLGLRRAASELTSARQTRDDRLVVRCHLGVEGSDVTFGVRGSTFRAHSCILAAQSPVLRSELRALAAEEPEGAWRFVAVDEEVSAEAFEVLLHVAYTDRLPDMGPLAPPEEAVESVLYAAERYGMERLKLRCEEWVAAHVGVRTVAGVLALAERHGCELLKATCVEFATPDYVWDRVKESDGFDRLRAACPHIVSAIESKQRKY